MFCQNCGSQVPDNASFCSNCGTPLARVQTQPQSQPQNVVPYDTAPYTEPKPQEQLGMGWHNFLIYFGLWLAALTNLITGFQFLTGSVYGADAATVYSVFGGLKFLDIVFGLATIGLVGYIIYVRFQLAKFKVDAPKKMVRLYVIVLCLSPAYLLIGTIITGISLFNASVLGSMTGSLIMLIINKKYYEKRAHLFVEP